MALRGLHSIPYIPMLGLKPAEMQALKELPESDKQLMMPLIQLGPWGAAHHLQSAISKIEEAYGGPCFLSLADVEQSGPERPVHQEIATLRSTVAGCANWCDFIESNSNFVPTLQLRDPSQITSQAARFARLDRGIMVLVERPGFSGIDVIAQSIASATNGGADVCFMLDIGRINRDIISIQLLLTDPIRQVRQILPNAYISVSGSSFPESFTSLARQEIFERALFDSVRDLAQGRLIYSDRGSARAERQGGGGGQPAPRIDYASSDQWTFFRSDDEDLERSAAYAVQARLAIASPDWDRNLRIWGTQMIERTALGDLSAIISPKRCTAARINIHLHRQTFYDDAARLYSTDDDWTD